MVLVYFISTGAGNQAFTLDERCSVMPLYCFCLMVVKVMVVVVDIGMLMVVVITLVLQEQIIMMKDKELKWLVKVMSQVEIVVLNMVIDLVMDCITIDYLAQALFTCFIY
jgi:hypothetical protein